MKTDISVTPTVFFDGSCPICRREIAFYRRREGSDKLSWVDVNQVSEFEVFPGLLKEQALSQFHFLNGDGRIISGSRAFAALWLHLPQFTALGRLFSIAPLDFVLEKFYRLFLHVRPFLHMLLRKELN